MQANGQSEVAIIGYGTAGVNAAIGLRTAGYEGVIRVFSDTDIPPYSPILTSYYASGEKTYEECFPWSAEELAELRLEVEAGAPVTELDPEAHLITTAKGTFPYAKCVIATGSTPACWGFPGVEGDEAFEPIVLRSMENAERLKAVLEDSTCKRMLVSGASMVALKTVEACLNKGVKVTLVGMNPHVLDFNALPPIAERFEKGLREKGVELKLGQVIKSVKRTDEGLEVTFSTGDVDVFDQISVSHGMKSNLDFVKPGSLEIDRALVVDEFMRTSDPDVYAAGDVAQGTELVSGQKAIVGIWKNAALQGACAGRAIAAELAGGEPAPECALKGSIATNTIAVNGTLFISAGTMAVTPERRTDLRETDDMSVLCIYEAMPDGGERLVGFNLCCDHDESGSVAYDLGAMLTLRIEAACKKA
ncbi:MAG: FAD-dependent oxidoreductase [Eggerthellaceae bacterium]|nr:FAD-dependent oxidoreductase [Eggerthellaceae bacterium]